MKLAALLLTLCSALAQAAERSSSPTAVPSGYLPEHTSPATSWAVRMGADYIEPDLQMSRDRVLVAIHDDTLQRTTTSQTSSPRATAATPGRRLHARRDPHAHRVKPTTTAAATYPASRRVPRAAGADLRRGDRLGESAATAVAGRTVGIYPEAKQADPAMEDQILATLKRENYAGAADKVFLQSFSDADRAEPGCQAARARPEAAADRAGPRGHPARRRGDAGGARWPHAAAEGHRRLLRTVSASRSRTPSTR